MLNYAEEWRRYKSQHGIEITAYLPVQDQTTHVDCRDGHCYEPSRMREKLSRLMILDFLHMSINHVLQPLYFNARQGLRMETAGNMRLRMHLIIGSCVSDNPETRGLLALKRGGMTNAPCYRCII